MQLVISFYKYYSMKYLFVVQGEGRGHLTQAISLKQMLESNGHEVVSVMVGCSRKRVIPEFFKQKIETDIISFQSPNFLPLPKEKRPFLLASIFYNLILLPVYIESIITIRKFINEKQPDIVVNFYELLCGLTYGIFRPSAPMVNIAHQYYFQTSNFKYTGKRKVQYALLNLYSYFTTLNAEKILALSFRNEESEQYEEITIVPPLIRNEIRIKQPSEGNYILGYLLNNGYVDELISWSELNPSEKLHFFWDKTQTENLVQMNGNLTMHSINDARFIRFMVGAKAYATTGGFESVCEAMYLNKPVLMVPSHIEQECNVIDALKSNAGVSDNSFNLDVLINHLNNHKPNNEFRYWVNAAESILLDELTGFELCEDDVYIAI